jgi:hypothetical protein
MIIALWVIGIHLIELIGILIYILVRKNIKLTKFVEAQQTRINNIENVLITGMERINELDEKGTFRSDDELGEFWEELKLIYKQLL